MATVRVLATKALMTRACLLLVPFRLPFPEVPPVFRTEQLDDPIGTYLTNNVMTVAHIEAIFGTASHREAVVVLPPEETGRNSTSTGSPTKVALSLSYVPADVREIIIGPQSEAVNAAAKDGDLQQDPSSWWPRRAK